MTVATDEQWIDEDEAACRLLVQAGDAIPAFFLECEQVAGFIITAKDATIVAGLVEEAHAAGKAMIIFDQLDLVQTTNADGVLLSESGRVAAARDELRKDHLVGAVCGVSRHNAMVAGEAGADYVTFGSLAVAPSGPFDILAELARWWSDLAAIPAVVASPLVPSQVQALADAGAGFAMLTQASLTTGAVDRAEFDALAAVLANRRVHRG